jgi:hypothetical protein
VCGTEAAIKRVNYDLRGNTLFNVIHGSKNARAVVEHSWATSTPDKFLIAPTISTVIETKDEIKQRRKYRSPYIIKCPKCGQEGRVNEYHQRLRVRPELTKFYVKHEYIGGTWGKSKLKRFRRCYFNQRPLDYS